MSLACLEPFFSSDPVSGELLRTPTSPTPWLSRAKDVRLARGFVLKASCRRRFLGYKSSSLELGEREVAEALRGVTFGGGEDHGDEVEIPLSQKAVAALDAFVGNDDGVLVRNGANFSKSCADVKLTRASMLVASLSRADGSVNLCVVVLNEAELRALRQAGEKDLEWKRQVDEKAKIAKAQNDFKKVEDAKRVENEEKRKMSSKKNSFFCCIPSSSEIKLIATPPTIIPATTAKSRMTSPVALASASTKTEIGTPQIPTQHRDAVDRAVRQIAQAASSESWDPAWRKVGAHEGATWYLKEGGKTTMVRGLIKAPPRSVFEYVWNEDLIKIDPRFAYANVVEQDVDGTGHTKTSMRQLSSEWAFARFGESDLKECIVVKHYHVHPDGTIFIVEISSPNGGGCGGVGLTEKNAGQVTGGLVIAPSQDDDLACHIAWIETMDYIPKNNLPSWALARIGAVQAKMLGDRVTRLIRSGISRQPYSDFQAALCRGPIVNYNGVSSPSSSQLEAINNNEAKDKMREFDELYKSSVNGYDASTQIQVREAMESVVSAIPQERARYRADVTILGSLLDELASSKRFAGVNQAAQYPFDCLTMFCLTQLPAQEAWVEALIEQLVMRNVEAQTTFNRQHPAMRDAATQADGAGGGPAGERISQIMSRSKGDRAPSL